jgi:hypothetical protein
LNVCAGFAFRQDYAYSIYRIPIYDSYAAAIPWRRRIAALLLIACWRLFAFLIARNQLTSIRYWTALIASVSSAGFFAVWILAKILRQLVKRNGSFVGAKDGVVKDYVQIRLVKIVFSALLLGFKAATGLVLP